MVTGSSVAMTTSKTTLSSAGCPRHKRKSEGSRRSVGPTPRRSPLGPPTRGDNSEAAAGSGGTGRRYLAQPVLYLDDSRPGAPIPLVAARPDSTAQQQASDRR